MLRSPERRGPRFGPCRPRPNIAGDPVLEHAKGRSSIRGWAAYLHGERLADRDPAAATRHLTDAVAAAEEVDDRFLSGGARHTLMMTASRLDEAGREGYIWPWRAGPAGS